MKRKYIIPALEVVNISVSGVICGSKDGDVTTGDDYWKDPDGGNVVPGWDNGWGTGDPD